MEIKEKENLNFIEQIVEEDLNSGKHKTIHTRFPPEPNGYLHIGHSKAICLNFGITEKFGGLTNLRFDDTNPATEETEFVESIKRDIKWLGYDWEDREYFTSDYFDTLYDYAVKLIQGGKAYVDESSAEELNALRGSTTEPDKPSRFRERPKEESLELFENMKQGMFEEGSMVLRAKIDLASSNMHLRDPVLYRIKKEAHHRTGTKWNIYPMYDFAHGQSDSIEGITHSLCSLEFENHRPLYNWLIENLEIFPSRQIEFARLNLSYTIMSKRKLAQLVTDGYVDGWDDPRMPTLSGLRRRGYPPEAIRNFADAVGIAKRENLIDLSFLEFHARNHLNKEAERRMVVLNPLKVVITNYNTDIEWLDAENNPEDESAGIRSMPFGRELWIEKTDFMLDPPKKYFRMAPGRNVRLKHAFILHCENYETDSEGEVNKVYCTYYPESKSGQDTSGIKAKGTLHWVSCDHATGVEVRMYDRLFSDPNPGGHKDTDFKSFINPESLTVLNNAKAEPELTKAIDGERFQFLRLGYFAVDPDSDNTKLIFNRTVGLRDTWAKVHK